MHDAMTTTPVTDTTADLIAARWTDLWNGNFALARELCAPDFRIAFAGAGDADGTHRGDAVIGPDAFVAFLHEFHAARPGVRFGIEGSAVGANPAVGHGSSACRWYAQFPDGKTVSGIDMFDTADGALVQVWSVTGSRRFPH